MHRLDWAGQIGRNHADFVRVLQGALFAVIESRNTASLSAVAEYQLETSQMLDRSLAVMSYSVRRAVSQLVDSARVQALSDARSELRPSEFDDETDEIVQHLRAHMTAEAAQAVVALRRMCQRHRMYMNQGLSYDAARIRAREVSRRDINKLTQRDRRGRAMPTQHAFFLTVAHHLAQVELHAYLAQAAALGYSRFVIVQPGHRRDGLEFTLTDVPYEHFHPQSQATVRLLGESDVYSPAQ